MFIMGHLRSLLQSDHSPHSKTQTKGTAPVSYVGGGKRENGKACHDSYSLYKVA